MKRVNVSELKAHLSAFLAAVRRGETVVVCDRSTPIARLVPFDEDRDGFVVQPATRSPDRLRTLRAVPLRRDIDLNALLEESRRER
jgi:prevent-host-death family protein